MLERPKFFNVELYDLISLKKFEENMNKYNEDLKILGL